MSTYDRAAYRQQMNRIMRPAAPPVLVENVYTDSEHDLLLDVVRRDGPWPTIIAQHFTTIEQLIATTSGTVPEGSKLTLDDVTRPNFRGFYANNSVCYYPELHELFYSRKFLDMAKSYWKAQYAKPTMYLFNFNGPMAGGPQPHVDTTTFRGVRYENSPTWLPSVMVKSGLFQDYMIKMAQVITWWYPEAVGGSFTYWPDGPLNPPQAIHPPMNNLGIIVQNETMFHRGDDSGPKEQRNPPGAKYRSLLQGDASDRNHWIITTDGQPIARYHTDQMRFLVHWNAEVYMDMAECKKVMDHTDDLSHERVFDTLLKDLHAKGVEVKTPSDPFNDSEFIRALIKTYDITPEVLQTPSAKAA